MLPNIPIKIERTGKKTKLTNLDLSNFGWNIVNQFEIPTGEIVAFLSTTFKRMVQKYRAIYHCQEPPKHTRLPQHRN